MKQMERWKVRAMPLRACLAMAGTYGICYLGAIAGLPYASFSVMTLPLAAVIFGLLQWTCTRLAGILEGTARRRRCRYAAVLSYLFSFTMILGHQLQTFGMTEGGIRGKCLILLRSGCLCIALFPFWEYLLDRIDRIPCHGMSLEGRQGWESGKVFGISALAIFLCLVPVWLAYYPAIMSYDFHRQINEAANGFAWFWPLQPLAHTWLIWLFLQLGRALGNLEAGMACMALFHMLVYSLVAAYACAFLYRILKKPWAVVAAILFFGAFPFHSVLVMCTTKDVLFATLFLLFLLLLAERSFFGKGKRLLAMDALIVLEGCVMMQFRNNCIYAVAAFGLFWVLSAGKREKLRALLLCILLVAGGKGLGMAVKAGLGTQLGTAKVEMYSVPIQQFTRVGYYHGEVLDRETRQLLDSYVPEECWQNYHPAIADSAKSVVAETRFPVNWDGQLAQLVGDWLRLGLRYPNEYMDAFLELTRGYWFLDDRSYAECAGYGTEERMGAIHTFNVSAMGDGTEILHESKFPWLEEKLQEIVCGNSYYGWPVVSILFKSSFYFWGLLVLTAACLFRRQKEQATICLFPLIYMSTMFLGPVAQVRYVFPLMLALPVLAVLLFIGNSAPTFLPSDRR